MIFFVNFFEIFEVFAIVFINSTTYVCSSNTYHHRYTHRHNHTPTHWHKHLNIQIFCAFMNYSTNKMLNFYFFYIKFALFVFIYYFLSLSLSLSLYICIYMCVYLYDFYLLFVNVCASLILSAAKKFEQNWANWIFVRRFSLFTSTSFKKEVGKKLIF